MRSDDLREPIHDIVLLSKEIEDINKQVLENRGKIDELVAKNAKLLVEKERKLNEINDIFGKMIDYGL